MLSSFGFKVFKYFQTIDYIILNNKLLSYKMESGDSADNANELTQLVQTMLTQMQSRFQTMSDNIIGRIDEMGNRIDDLEKSIADLV